MDQADFLTPDPFENVMKNSKLQEKHSTEQHGHFFLSFLTSPGSGSTTLILVYSKLVSFLVTVLTVLGSIPASSDTLESETRQMEQ